jgi:hypothetical protein
LSGERNQDLQRQHHQSRGRVRRQALFGACHRVRVSGIISGCTCNRRDVFSLITTPVADDPTLRPGDVVATNEGLMAYNGGPNGSTFTPINAYADLSADLRRINNNTAGHHAAIFLRYSCQHEHTDHLIDPRFRGRGACPQCRFDADRCEDHCH